MNDEALPPEREQPRDSAYWAQPVATLQVIDAPAGAMTMNIDGRQVVGPLQGFGQLWQKTYRIHLSGVDLTPAEVMAIWKANFAAFQPPENHFYPLGTGLQPGGLVLIDTMLPAVPGLPGVIPLASGVMVLYADESTMTVMTPEGHPEAGWNTFSVFEENGELVAQIQSLARANDPIYEFGFRFMGGAQKQEQTWTYVLTSLARHFGVEGQVEIERICLDPHLQWRQAGNIWRNAGLRTMLYTAARPLRLARAKVRERLQTARSRRN